MVAGVPVLGSNAGGIPFMVVHELSGWIVPVGDASAWADAITDVAKNPDRLIASA
jgi:glycosyltransferase involved in cell wall biosynthesis